MSNRRNDESFFPVIGRDAVGKPRDLTWRYRVNGGAPVTAIVGNITYVVSTPELVVAVDRNTLQRTASLSGQLTGYYSGYSGLGTIRVDYAENLHAGPSATWCDWQQSLTDIAGVIAGSPYAAASDLITDEYVPPVEWFVDRTDLEALPVGFVYNPVGGVKSRVHGIRSSCGMQRGEGGDAGGRGFVCTPVGVDDTGVASERWEILDKLSTMPVLGVVYGNVVVVKRRTRVVDPVRGLVPEVDVTYHVAKGIGIVKATGAYRLFGQDFPIELVSTDGR